MSDNRVSAQSLLVIIFSSLSCNFEKLDTYKFFLNPHTVELQDEKDLLVL